MVICHNEVGATYQEASATAPAGSADAAHRLGAAVAVVKESCWQKIGAEIDFFVEAHDMRFRRVRVAVVGET